MGQEKSKAGHLHQEVTVCLRPQMLFQELGVTVWFGMVDIFLVGDSVAK